MQDVDSPFRLQFTEVGRMNPTADSGVKVKPRFGLSILTLPTGLGVSVKQNGVYSAWLERVLRAGAGRGLALDVRGSFDITLSRQRTRGDYVSDFLGKELFLSLQPCISLGKRARSEKRKTTYSSECPNKLGVPGSRLV